MHMLFFYQKTTSRGRVRRQLLIFPWGCPQSIVRAEKLNFRVRDGNGCTLFAIVTSSPAHAGGFLDTMYITIGIADCQHLFDTGSPKNQGLGLDGTSHIIHAREVNPFMITTQT